MPASALQSTELIATLAIGFCAALLLGYVAQRLRLSAIVGYMLAGIAIGPHTPGFVADQALADQLAEIGIVLLMFGVGLHFSWRELLAVRRIAVRGAIGQSAASTALGLLVAIAIGWGWTAGLVFGFALSVASTVVLVRGLQEAGTLHTLHGHVALGWLIVEDLLTVGILVLLPALVPGGEGDLVGRLVATVLNLAGLALVYAAAVRIVPWFLGHVARLQSRELFTLAVLAAAVGVAYGSAQAFGVSLALGAFLGGLVVGHSDLSHQAAADALPLRDAFAVLFFVSVGMLFDPAYLLAHPGLVLLTVVIVLLAKPLAAVVIVVALRYPLRTALTVSAGLAQIGEFSFIVGGLGRTLDLLPPDALHAILAAAFLTIALNPLLFRLVAPAETLLRRWSWLARHAAGAAAAGVAHDQDEPRRGHVVLCGHGRVGSLLARVLYERGTQLLVIEQDRSTVQALAGGQVAALHGDASNPYVLALAQLPTARLLLITLPDPIATRQIVDQARLLNPRLPVVARVHATGERQHLERQQGVEAVLGELELSLEMARLALQKLGVSAIEAQAVALDHRRRSGQSTEPSGARVLEAQVRAGSPAEGKSLTELGLGRGALVMAISRAGEFLVPDGQTRLAGGDTLLVIADREGLPRVRELLGR